MDLILIAMLCHVYLLSERPLEEPESWSRLQLSVVILVPSCLLCVGVLLGVFAVQGHYCAYSRALKRDPEEPLDDQMIMSADKCLQDLIYDMSTSGSGSGKRVSTGQGTAGCDGRCLIYSGLVKQLSNME